MSYQEEMDRLRSSLTKIDRRIVESIAQRQHVVSQIGELKRKNGLALRDYRREKVVLDNTAALAVELGIAPRMIESIVRILIRYSLLNQEKNLIEGSSQGDGRRALVIGGAGAMGRWFVELFQSQGFRVDIVDPAVKTGLGHYNNLHDATNEYDVTVVSTPISITNGVLKSLADQRWQGLIFDVSTLKSPLRSGIKELLDKGCKVASVHPMFGPKTELLSQKHLIFVDTGCDEATQAAKALFEDTMVEQIDLQLDEHDRLVAFILGLSHALNISFVHALRQSGESASKLMKMSSTTFDAQLSVAGSVAREDPALYFEIQHLNDYGLDALDALCKSMDHIRELVKSAQREEFQNVMNSNEEYLALRRRGDSGSQGTGSRRQRASD